MKDRSFGPMKKRLVFETETELDWTDPTLALSSNGPYQDVPTPKNRSNPQHGMWMQP